MATYYLLLGVFALLHGSACIAYSNFKGSSRNAKNFLSYVAGVGFVFMIIVLICNFFLMPWYIALALIFAECVIIPVMGMWLNHIPLFGPVSAILAIPVSVLLFRELLSLFNR